MCGKGDGAEQYETVPSRDRSSKLSSRRFACAEEDGTRLEVDGLTL